MGLVVLLLIVLQASWACDARQILSSDILNSGGGIENNQVCNLCETYATQAIDYITRNQTQQKVTDLLHASCSRMMFLEDECVTLVDYYAPRFFSIISTIQPKDICDKVNLCKLVSISSIVQSSSGDGCDLCHQAAAQVILKLQDPDTQMDILELILKGCSSLDNKYVRQLSKSMVVKYVPLILTNGAKFLENKDICTALHACEPKISSI